MKLADIILKEELSPQHAATEMAKMIVSNPERQIKVPSGFDKYTKTLLLKLGANMGFEGGEVEVLEKVIEGDLLKNKDKIGSIQRVGVNDEGKIEIMTTPVATPEDPRQGRGPRPGERWTGD